MTVEEVSLYANLYVETSPVQATASWTNHMAKVSNILLTRGGVEQYVGVNQVEAGSGTITLIDLSATIDPGYWIRVRYSSTNIWSGFVQDVNTTYSFINNEKFAVTTLVVLDWVAWISQYSFNSYAQATTVTARRTDLNTLIDPTTVSLPIATAPNPTLTYALSEIDQEMNVSAVLDLTANSISNGFWRGTRNNPTGYIGSAGFANVVELQNTNPTINAAFTDGTHTGSPTNLTYYNDIQMVTQTSSVANSIVVNDSFRPVVSTSGILVYRPWESGMTETTYKASDATSIATYGARLASVDTSIVGTQIMNLMEQPSFEGSKTAWSSTNWSASIEQPVNDSSGSWAAKDGTSALRILNLTGSGTFALATDDQRIDLTNTYIPPYDASKNLYVVAYGAHSNSSSVRGRAFVTWYNESGGVVSTTYGSYVTFTTARTWYKTSLSTAGIPVGAVSARVGVYIDRSTGAAFASGAKLWSDMVFFGWANSLPEPFSGDTPDTATYLYDWFGGGGSSRSYRMDNALATIATNVLNANKTPKYTPVILRMNAQANLTVANLLDTYSTIYVWQGAHRWTSVITGMSHNITVNSDGTTRWMIDLNLRPSTYTI